MHVVLRSTIFVSFLSLLASVCVVAGSSRPHSIDLYDGDLSLEGVVSKIFPDENWPIKGSVSYTIGDINGDGYGDLALTTSQGMSGSSDMQLTELDEYNFRILYGPFGNRDLHYVPDVDTYLRFENATDLRRRQNIINPIGKFNDDDYDDFSIITSSDEMFVVFGQQEKYVGEISVNELFLSGKVAIISSITGTRNGLDLERMDFSGDSYGGRDSLQGGADYDGDGFDDLLLALPTLTIDDVSSAGGIWIIYGGGDVQGGNAYAIDQVQGTLVYATTSFGSYGKAAAFIGDINDDGRSEIAVASSYNNQGLVQIILGRADKPAPLESTFVFFNDTSSACLTGYEGKNSYFGQKLFAPGDIDGDGKADLAASESVDGDYYFILKLDQYIGDARTCNPISVVDNPVPGFALESTEDDTMYASPARTFDFNGDGVNDFLYGLKSSEYDRESTFVNVFLGSAALASLTTHDLLSVETDYAGIERFQVEKNGDVCEGSASRLYSAFGLWSEDGLGVSAGDFDGDGKVDIVFDYGARYVAEVEPPFLALYGFDMVTTQFTIRGPGADDYSLLFDSVNGGLFNVASDGKTKQFELEDGTTWLTGLPVPTTSQYQCAPGSYITIAAMLEGSDYVFGTAPEQRNLNFTNPFGTSVNVYLDLTSGNDKGNINVLWGEGENPCKAGLVLNAGEHCDLIVDYDASVSGSGSSWFVFLTITNPGGSKAADVKMSYANT